MLFDSLAEVNPGGEYASSLANSWTIENGGTKVTSVLRDDAVRHSHATGGRLPADTKLSADNVVSY